MENQKEKPMEISRGDLIQLEESTRNEAELNWTGRPNRMDGVCVGNQENLHFFLCS